MANYDLMGLRASLTKAASGMQKQADGYQPRTYLTTSPHYSNRMGYRRKNDASNLYRGAKGRMTPQELDYIHKNWDSIMNDDTPNGRVVRDSILDRMQAAGGASELTPGDLPWTGVGNDVRHAKIAPKSHWRSGVAPVLGAYQKQYDDRYTWMQKAIAKKNGRTLPGEEAPTQTPAAPAPAPAPQTPVQNPITPQPESTSDVTTVKPTTPVGNGSVTLGGPVDLTPKTTDVGSMAFPAPTTPAAPSAAPTSADEAFDKQVEKYKTEAAAAPAPAPAPAQAPAQAAPKMPTMQDLRGISRQQMMQNRKWTAARNMNSEMDRWKTWMAMNGNRNASNADYRAWKQQQGQA